MNRAVLALMLMGVAASAAPTDPQAPPPALAIERPGAPVLSVGGARPARSAVTAPYSIGEPTDDEQLYLELLNRTRADALAEALRLANTTDPDILSAYQFFSVDRQKFVQDTAGYPRVQPLSFEPRITQAARAHSAWMLANGRQDHDETDPPGSANVVNTLGTRLDAVGYPLSAAGESIFAFAKNPEQGHAGFEVDWGGTPATGGMQVPPGHRINNHNAAYREVGIGVLNGTGPNGAGPQVVTIDFGSRNGLAPLVTGVAYYDLNGNQFYDKGEGIGGLTVNVSDSGFHAVTAASGGYTVPSANGARTVTFGGAGLAATNLAVNLAGENQKVDLRLAYAPPNVTGPLAPGAGNPSAYTFPPVPGATAYTWEAAQLQAWSGVEGAEAGAPNVTFTTTDGYNPISTVKRTGAASFHLAHKSPPAAQFFTLKTKVRPKPGAQLVFWKKLGFSSDTESAVVQVSSDGGLSWTSIWTQAGNSKATNSNLIETTFTQRSVDLAAHVGKNLQVRFGYLFTSGSFFPGDSDNHGLFVDDIAFTATDVLLGTTTSPVTLANSFLFVPPVTGTFLLSVQPRVGNNLLPAGPVLSVAAVAAPANLPPAFTGLTDRTVAELSPLAFNLTAIDVNVPAQPLTFSRVSGPAGLTVAANGAVAWTPAEPDGPGTNTVTVQVSDGQLTDTKSFKVVVSEVNVAPVLADVADLQVDEQTPLNLALTATDADLPAQPLVFSLVSGPAGLTVSGTGTVHWTPGTAAGPSTNAVTARVSDGSLNDEITFKVIVRDAVQSLVVGQVAIKQGPNGKIRMDFAITGGTPTSVILEQAAQINGPYVNSSEIVSVSGPGLYSFKSLEAAGNSAFFRIRAQ